MGGADDLVTLSRRVEMFLGCPPLLRLNGKRPLDSDWTEGPRHDPDAWRARLDGHRGNSGVLCGAGLLALDFDVYKPDGADTLRTLEDLGWIPTGTVRARSGRGGLHVFLRYDPARWQVGSGDFKDVVFADGSRLPGGAEWRGDGGQIVICPSVHPDTGLPYLWEDESAPWDTPLVEACDDLLAAIGSRVGAATTGEQSGPRRAGWAAYDPAQVDPVTAEAVAVLVEHFGGHAPLLHYDRAAGVYVSITRPGKKPDGSTSATAGFSRPGHVRVWSTNWKGLPARSYSLGELRSLAGIDPPRGFDVRRPQRALVYGRDVKSEATLWLWEERIPACQLVLAAGQEKLGKSSALVWACSRLTTGDLPGDFEGHPMAVAYVSAEDDSAHVLKPRFVAAGGDPDRYLLLAGGEPFSFDELRNVDPRPGVVVFDPISAFIELRRGSRENDEIAIRQALLDFQQLATSEGITVIGVRHTKKGPAGDNALDAVLGSKAWVATPRALLMFTPDRDHEERRGGLIFTHGNLAVPSPPLRYRLDERTVPLDRPLARPSTGEIITQANVVVFVAEPGPVGISLDEALGSRSEAANRAEAEAFLVDVLGDGGEHLAADVIAESVTAGIAASTLQRATRKLGVQKRREGFGKGSQIWWSLPANPPT